MNNTTVKTIFALSLGVAAASAVFVFVKKAV